MLILVVPKSQLVLSIDNVKFVLCGKSEKISREIMSSDKAKSAINLRMHLKEDVR